MEKEKLKEMSRIEDETSLARIKAKADADYYTAQKESEANTVERSLLSSPCPSLCFPTPFFSPLSLSSPLVSFPSLSPCLSLSIRTTHTFLNVDAVCLYDVCLFC